MRTFTITSLSLSLSLSPVRTHTCYVGSTMSAKIPGWRSAPWHTRREPSFDRRAIVSILVAVFI